jgi:non-heme chloroperoxidase
MWHRRKDVALHHIVDGAGGTRLHLVETGNARGPAILFLHGFSQCSLAWDRQLHSDLARDCRLIAMDLRGHGGSGRPLDRYDDSKVWADDVDAVIRELKLYRPLLCGWSYGPLVILDYIRHYGQERISGVHFVGGITKLGSEEATTVLTPQLLALVPGLLSQAVDESVPALDGLLRRCFVHTPSETELYTMLGYNAAVPPFVRRALFGRAIDNDELMRTIEIPVLITHGAKDAIVHKVVVDQHKAHMPHAEVHIVPNAGHAPFWDDAAEFNRRLLRFSATLSRADRSRV